MSDSLGWPEARRCKEKYNISFPTNDSRAAEYRDQRERYNAWFGRQVESWHVEKTTVVALRAINETLDGKISRTIMPGNAANAAKVITSANGKTQSNGPNDDIETILQDAVQFLQTCNDVLSNIVSLSVSLETWPREHDSIRRCPDCPIDSNQVFDKKKNQEDHLRAEHRDLYDEDRDIAVASFFSQVYLQ